jgi:integrase
MRITDKGVAAAVRRAAATGKSQWLGEPAGPHGSGRWEVRASANGIVRAYWRGQQRGRDGSKALGVLGADGSIPQIRARAHALGMEFRASGLHVVAPSRPSGGSLTALLEAYAARLAKVGKHRSALDVRSTIRVHIAGSRLAAAPAAGVEPDELVDLIRAAAGKPRTADKLRSFLQSAYRAAIAARFDASADPELAAFGIKANPVAVIPPVKGGRGKPGRRHLAEDDLGAVLHELLKQSTTAAQAVVLALFLGGQRAAQTARIKLSDVNGDVRLLDPKGRREQPREHWLPLLGRARAIVDARVQMARQVGDDFLFQGVNPRTGKKTSVRPETMNEAVKQARDAAMQAGHRWSESAQGFTLRELRRTAETLLARSGISKDDRAQLLSHGLGGVQGRHYDRHEYMDEKRAALVKWSALLERLARRGSHGKKA